MTLRSLTAADAADLAFLHATSFDAPWAAAEFAELLTSPGVFGLRTDDGFILCRAAAGEAEILTLAVKPDHRRAGLGRALIEAAILLAGNSAETMFLEVASDNRPALGLYKSSGFAQVGLRRGYYASGADALVLRRALNS